MLRLLVTFLAALAIMASALIMFSWAMHVLFLAIGNPTVVIVFVTSTAFGFAVAFTQYLSQREKL